MCDARKMSSMVYRLCKKLLVCKIFTLIVVYGGFFT